MKYLIEDIGLEHPQYFQGRGIVNTNWDQVFVGTGLSAYEALEECIEFAEADIDNTLSTYHDPKLLNEDNEMLYHVALYIKRDNNVSWEPER